MGKVADIIKRGQRKGFTIVELLIVIVVIGILAAIVLVGYGAVVNNANDGALKDDISKLGDAVKLATLDNNGVPDGGATSSNTGDPTVLNGVTFKPTVGDYDQTVANLYYCAGVMNGTEEFTIVARSKSGNAFSYSSTSGIKNFSGYTWTTSNNGVTVCGLAGYTAPFTWSYGYNATPNYGWYAWAFNGTILTNLITNPSFETDASSWIYGARESIARSINYASSGGAAGLMTRTSATAGEGYTGIRFATTVGNAYTASITARNNSSTPSLQFSVRNSNMGWSVVSGSSVVSVTPTNSFVKYNINFTAQDTTTLLLVEDVSNINGASVYIDGAMAVQGTTVPTYADGNTPRWSWTGLANNSTSTGPAL